MFKEIYPKYITNLQKNKLIILWKEKKINSLSISEIYKSFQNINKFDTIKWFDIINKALLIKK